MFDRFSNLVEPMGKTIYTYEVQTVCSSNKINYHYDSNSVHYTTPQKVNLKQRKIQ